MTSQILATDDDMQAIALYVVLERDPLDFLEMVAEAPAAVVVTLYGMLTTPHPTSDMERNAFGAGLIEGIYRRHVAAARKDAAP